jgi:hypothetical protein
VKHVTQKPKEEIERSPFPAFEWKPRSDTAESEPLKTKTPKSKKRRNPKATKKTQDGPRQESPDSEQAFEHNEEVTQESLRKLAESPEPDVHPVAVFHSPILIETCVHIRHRRRRRMLYRAFQ